jgi:membrane protein implicated in regulation of membrane protease activity
MSLEFILGMPSYVNWLFLGFFLGILEICTASYFFLWLAISCISTGLVTYFFSIGMTNQYLFFSVFLLLTFLITRYFRHNHETKASLAINEYEKRLIGIEVALLLPIENGVGYIKLHDTLWKVNGTDAPLGAKVKVLEVRDNTLIVTPVGKNEL